jgi:hypothetical protein
MSLMYWEPDRKDVLDFADDKESDSKDVPDAAVEEELFARKYLTQLVDEDHNDQEVLVLLLTRNYTVPNIKSIYFRKRNCAASVPIPTFMCLEAINVFPGLVHIFGCSKIDKPILEIYKSLTDIGV